MALCRSLKSALLAAFAVTALAAGAALAQDQVNVRFSWKMKGEYAPMYYALEKGFYKRENLNVRMGEGAGAQAALGALLQGQEDIVILPGVFVLSAIQKGMPVKMVALYHPVTPVVLISFPDKPVRTPKDMEGKTLAHSIGETGTSYLDVFCKLNGVDCAKVKKITVNAQSRVPQFIQRQFDVVSVYKTNDLPILDKTHKTPFVVLDMASFGMSIPGMAAVTSDAHIAKKPDVIKRYLRATGAGAKDIKTDLEGATRAIIKNWPGSPETGIVYAQIRATAEAIPNFFTKPVGWIDEKLIADTLEMMKSVGEIDAPKPVSTYVTNILLGN